MVNDDIIISVWAVPDVLCQCRVHWQVAGFDE